MFYLIAAIVCVVLATIIVWSFFDLSINYGFKTVIKSKYAIFILIIGIGLAVAAFPLHNKYTKDLQSSAIDHYVVGDYELHEDVVNGKTVDWKYVITPADYD